MLNRAANALYWMSRYLERAESTARLIQVNLLLSLDLPGRGGHLESGGGDHGRPRAFP